MPPKANAAVVKAAAAPKVGADGESVADVRHEKNDKRRQQAQVINELHWMQWHGRDPLNFPSAY